MRKYQRVYQAHPFFVQMQPELMRLTDLKSLGLTTQQRRELSLTSHRKSCGTHNRGSARSLHASGLGFGARVPSGGCFPVC